MANKMITKQVVLITGGARGIGLGIAKCLAANGYHLAICGVKPANKVRYIMKELNDYGIEAMYQRADISNKKDRRDLLRKIKNRLGQLNHLVNNAGVAPLTRDDILDASEGSFERLIKINLQGPYFLTQAVANWMIAQKKTTSGFPASIINITSVSSEFASTNRGDYCISKAGLSMATKLWASRLGEFSIPVYEIRPGIILTDMTSSVKRKYDKLIKSGMLIEPRWGTPGDIGKAALTLLSNDLPYATGSVLHADGGFSVRRL